MHPNPLKNPMSWTTPRRGLIWASAVVASLLPWPADADEPARDPAAADALYRQGRELIKAGKWKEGCAKFDGSMALVARASTLINVARCHEHDGKLARALAMYQRSLILNRETLGDQRRRDLQAVAEKAIVALEPRVPRLLIRLGRAPSGTRVVKDGQELPTAILGEALPVDPGSYEIVAEATDYEPVRRHVVVEEGATVEVVLDLDKVLTPTEKAPASPEVSPTAEAKHSDAGMKPSDSARAPADSAKSTGAPVLLEATGGPPAWAWVAGVSGLALIGAGVAFRIDGAAAEERLAVCEDQGDGPICPPDAGLTEADIDDLFARQQRDLGLFIGFTAGGAIAVGAMLVGLATAPPEQLVPVKSSAIVYTPWVSGSGLGMRMGGAF